MEIQDGGMPSLEEWLGPKGLLGFFAVCLFVQWEGLYQLTKLADVYSSED